MYFYNVLLDIAIDKPFTYKSETSLLIGTRVLVEFINKQKIAYIWEEITVEQINYDINKIKNILYVYPEILSSEIIDLVKFSAKYYHYPLGQTLFTAIPIVLRKNLEVKHEYFKQYQLDNSVNDTVYKKFTLKQKELYDLLSKNIIISFEVFKSILGITYNRLIDKWLELKIIKLVNKSDASLLNYQCNLTLNEEQQSVVDKVKCKITTQFVGILYGVTGSGKTEVYLSLINYVLNQNKQVLFLVPEINLTPQLLNRFKLRFPDTPMHILTSDVSPNERLAGYMQALSGDKKIIIGTRLSVFTPFKDLGLIIVDEEHDQSFKQNEGLRYNARDLAVYKAKYHNVPIILGSATPSLETLYNYKLNKYELFKLTQRGVVGAVLPSIKLIDIRNKPIFDGLTEEVIETITDRLNKQELVLVYINRRGYAPVVSCYDCGFVCTCKNCSTNMVLHADTKRLKCHQCGFSCKIPDSCPKCHSKYIYALGQGTQKIEEKLQQLFIDARILRIDQDTTNKKSAWDTLYNKIHNNEVDILVGTQMLAKGHDFHNLTLVVGLNLDSGLYSYDFRAMESLFIQLMQVSGRAGRGAKVGEVLLQTRYPEHELYQYLIKHDYSGFANYLLKTRKLLSLPPYVHYVLFRSSSSTIKSTMDYLNKVYDLLLTQKPDYIEVLAPVPSVIQRLKNKERGQLLIYASNRSQLHDFLNKLLPQIAEIKHKKGVLWNVDIDPTEM